MQAIADMECFGELAKDERGCDAVRQKFGSKIARVIETIRAIHAEEGEDTKCVVFIQWDAIAAHLERGLEAVGIKPLVLRGQLLQRQRVISRFVDSKTADSSVLMLSLDQSPTGMNLVCSHHVLLVHPMHAERAEDAVTHEVQAIGRVRRQGQKHIVHVHRFVARGTVEESLSRRHHAVCVQKELRAAVQMAELGPSQIPDTDAHRQPVDQVALPREAKPQELLPSTVSALLQAPSSSHRSIE